MVLQEHNIANQQPVRYVLQCFIFYSTKTQNSASFISQISWRFKVPN